MQTIQWSEQCDPTSFSPGNSLADAIVRAELWRMTPPDQFVVYDTINQVYRVRPGVCILHNNPMGGA